jgi:hypothetical protein
MSPTLPIHVLDVNQSKVRLVHEGGRLQAVANSLPGHEAPSDSTELRVHDLYQTFQSPIVAFPPRE